MNELKTISMGKRQAGREQTLRVPYRDLIDKTKQVFHSYLTAHFQTGNGLLAGPTLTNLTALLGTSARVEEFYELVSEYTPKKDRKRILRSIQDAYNYGLFLFHVLKPDFADVEAQICRNLKAKLRTIEDPISDKQVRSLCENVWALAAEKKWPEIENEFYELTRKRKLDYLELDLIHDTMSLRNGPTSDLRARTHVLLGVLRGWKDNERDLLGSFEHEAITGLLKLNAEFYQLIETKLKRGVDIEVHSS